MPRPDSELQVRVAQQGVEVRASTIPGAGQGVFATMRLPANRVIGLYRGETITPQEFDARYPQGTLGEYVLQISRDRFIDARDPAHGNWTRYVNDGHLADGRNLCNLSFTPRAGLRTKRPIEIGEELFVSYGPHYF
jgi:hypothetical protein